MQVQPMVRTVVRKIDVLFGCGHVVSCDSMKAAAMPAWKRDNWIRGVCPNCFYARPTSPAERPLAARFGAGRGAAVVEQSAKQRYLPTALAHVRRVVEREPWLAAGAALLAKRLADLPEAWWLEWSAALDRPTIREHALEWARTPPEVAA